MAAGNMITIDHINDFFCLDKPLGKIKITPTLTNGLGIDTREEFPLQYKPKSKAKGTDYAKKYIEQEYSSVDEDSTRQTLDLPGGSTINLNEFNHLNEVEEWSTQVTDIAPVNDLQDDNSHDLYETYYGNSTHRYNPELSITHYREKILHLVETNQAVVIQGSTGCGKTTQVPQFILDQYARLGKYCNIMVTQPRKIAAISVARRVCQERNWSLGTIVGYQVAMDNKISVDTRLSYVTTGVLLQRLVNNRRMDMYTHIIIDEVHERDQDTDFVLLVVKKLLRENSRNVRVVLMSATIDTMMFANYFSYLGRGDAAPIVEVLGKNKEVTEHYLHELSQLGVELPTLDLFEPSIPEELYDIAMKLIIIFDTMEKKEQIARNGENSTSTPSRGTVLVFLPGYEEISNMSKRLTNMQVTKKLWILPLHSSVTIEEQTKVFSSAATGFRKIILSTNIAESSITVPDIKYVIDFCLTKNLVCEPETNYTCLKLEWASKANCVQRKGRAGRVDIGKVYRLVPYDFYEKHISDTGIPEIKRCPLHQTVLGAKKLNFGEPQALLALAIEPPDLSDIEKAILTLKEVGALAVTVKGEVSPYDGDLTFIGRVMAGLPLDVKVSKLIILGYVFDCLEDCLIIAASLSLKCFLAKPFQKMLDGYKSRLAWADGTFSDCLAYLQTFNMWKSLHSQGHFNRPGFREADWGSSNFVQIRSIREVDMLVKELKRRLERMNIHVNYHRTNRDAAANILILKVAIAGAFFPNYFIQDPIDEKDVMRDVNNNDPLSTVIVSGIPTNHGLLYACAIRDMMWCCGPRMNIDFEGNKAYVKFERSSHAEEFGVLTSVYLAVKLRHLKRPLELQLYEPQDAERKIQQLRRMKEAEDGEPNTGLRSNRMCVQLKTESLKQVDLPSVQTMTVKIFISYIVDCGHFWSRYADQTSKLNLEFLSLMINSLNGKNLQEVNKSAVKPGVLLLAPFADRHQSNMVLYYRARVDEIDSRGARKEVRVFYIDYGNSGKVNIEDLRQIDQECSPDVMTMPSLAFECQLSEIKPSALKSPNGLWSKEANNYFASEVSGKVIDCKVYSVVDNIVRLEVYPGANSSPVCINKRLIEMGLADQAEESYKSKQDKEYRDLRSMYATSNISLFNENKAVHFTMDDTTNLELTKTTHIIRLRGPYSPLEVRYQGMTHSGNFRSVNIDRDSVNSISLNFEPQDSHEQMLVGCHVGLNPSGSALSVRNTTLMPKIHGLPALICLLFAPFAELRADPKRHFYTGAICGLGYDPATGQSLYPEHDIELIFDSEIETNDIREINSIRMAFNVILGNEDELAEWNASGLRNVREYVKDKLLSLLQKIRKSRAPQLFANKYHWNQIPVEHILSPELQQSNCPLVYPLHSAINLSTDNSLQIEMKAHLESLYQKAGRSVQRMTEKCKLCSVTLFSPRELMMHLDTADHREKEKMLIQD